MLIAPSSHPGHGQSTTEEQASLRPTTVGRGWAGYLSEVLSKRQKICCMLGLEYARPGTSLPSMFQELILERGDVEVPG
ncbi:hypothetical protein NDU88_002161 [Pleurodeles waltl]|uniref:Uncharacterized protein n=1 Tax=Pleurodeles waltl TaxID=8319 RepID=A0AAV7UXJ6_PLEWA|nr:hypothetical protein NDU88_002161 [Pleurodeles waltl]